MRSDRESATAPSKAAMVVYANDAASTGSNPSRMNACAAASRHRAKMSAATEVNCCSSGPDPTAAASTGLPAA